MIKCSLGCPSSGCTRCPLFYSPLRPESANAWWYYIEFFCDFQSIVLYVLLWNAPPSCIGECLIYYNYNCMNGPMSKLTVFSDIFFCWQEDTGHLRAVLSLLQSGVGANHDAQPPHEHKPDPKQKPCRPAWCKCDHCTPSSVPQEELCCRQSAGPCITSSPLFGQLVLSHSLLEAVLLYRDPLSSLADRGQAASLRHCAYRQYISWRFGVPPNDTHPVIPSCCVWRVREEYPSPDGQYSGFRPVRIVSMQACTNGELWEECFCIAEQGLPTDHWLTY